MQDQTWFGSLREIGGTSQGSARGFVLSPLFLSMNAPHQPLTRVGVSWVVTYLARRAGIEERVGAHRLRHSAATAVLAGGGTLAVAGQLLRRRSAQATAIYAKTDQRALAGLARPWPVDGTAHE